MKLLDLAKFEKVKEGKDTTTMRHKDGHEMIILVSKLPKIHREQLKRLKMAEGGIARKDYDDGSKEETINEDDQAPIDASSDISNTSSDRQPADTNDPDTMIPADQTPPTIGQLPSVVSPIQQNNPLPSQMPNATGIPNLANVTNANNVPAQVVSTGTQAANEKAAYDAAVSKGMLPINQQQEQNAQIIQDRQNQSIADMQMHTKEFADYMNQNPINPNAYLENMDAGRKITTSLGLILGGIGGRGNGNVAADFLNQQINRDVDAQKARANQQATIYGAYRHLYDNENIATNLTKVSMGDKLIAQANQMADRLGTAKAAYERDNLVSQIQSGQYQNLKQAAWLQSAPKYIPGTQGQPHPGASGNPIAHPSNSPNPLSNTHSAGNQIPKPGQPDQSGVINQYQSILRPGAAGIHDDLARRSSGGDPIATSQLAQVDPQYSAAEKADQVLQRAPGVYKSLVQSPTFGGWTSRNATQGITAPLVSIPVIGPIAGGIGAAISGAAGNITTGAQEAYQWAKNKAGMGPPAQDLFSQNRQYDTARQELGDLLRSVYPGISGGEFNNKLDAIVPDYYDKPADITKKMKTFEDLVKTSHEFNVIRDRKMANRH